MVDNNNSESKMLSGSYLIGEWTFQSQVFQLIRGQDVIKLEPRVAHLLTHLSENPGIAVSREVLMEEVWPGMIVGDEALTNAINKLRKAFQMIVIIPSLLKQFQN